MREVPASIGPVVFGHLGGWITVRRSAQPRPAMRRAGGMWDPGARHWLIQPHRIGAVIRHLERTTDPLFRQAAIRLDP